MNGPPSWARAPFASRPIGPFHLLTNPAAVVRIEHLGLHLGFQPDGDEGPIRFIAYSDPGLGFAAGALIWFDGGKGPLAWREITYALARYLTDRVAVGLAIKHTAASAEERWSADVGLYIPTGWGLELGVVYYDAFGATEDDPGEVVASASWSSPGGWAASVEVEKSLAAPGGTPLVTWAVDVPVGKAGTLRAAHRSLTDAAGKAEWLASLRWDLVQYGFDVTAAFPPGEEVRYRFGFWFAF